MKDSYSISSFKKSKQFLLCVNSSGTAINDMEKNHQLCYGPSFIEVWDLKTQEAIVQEIWNKINLYEKTRGVSRFIALLTMLKRINGKLIPKTSLVALERWISQTDKLSVKNLKLELDKHPDPVLEKALEWSELVNQKMASSRCFNKEPFQFVRDSLEIASKYCDIAVISGANRQAIIDEWQTYDLLKFVDVIGSQEEGSKSESITKLIQKGYKKDYVMMMGDVISDFNAAISNHVSFYPIIIHDEVSSWNIFKDFYLTKFTHHNFGNFQEALTKMFMSNFDKVTTE